MKSIPISVLGIAAAFSASITTAEVWQPDPSFAPELIYETDVTRDVQAVADSTNRFLVFATWPAFTHVNGTRQSGLARLRPDGSVDPTLADLERQSSFQIIGTTSDGGAWAIAIPGVRLDPPIIPVESSTVIRRLTADGSVADDAAPITLKNYSGALVLPDDSLVVYGLQLDEIAGQTRAGIARFYANGILDPIYAPEINIEGAQTQRAFVDSAGRVLVWRRSFSQGAQHHDLLRLTANGSIDPTFSWRLDDVRIDEMVITADRVVVGDSGKVRSYDYAGQLRSTSSLTGTSPNAAWTVGNLNALPDGRILGRFWQHRSEARSMQHLVRLNADLTLDRSWPASLATPAAVVLLAVAPNGTMLLREETDIDTPEESAQRLVLASDTEWTPLPHSFTRREPGSEVYLRAHDEHGGVTVSGRFTHIDGETRDGTARFLADGTLDPTFAPPRVYPVLPLRDGGLIAWQRLAPTYWGEGYRWRTVHVTATGEINELGGLSDELSRETLTWLREGRSGELLVAWHDEAYPENRTHLIWLNRDGSEARRLPFPFAALEPLPNFVTMTAVLIDESVSSEGIIDQAVELDDGSLLVRTRYYSKTGEQSGRVFHLEADGTPDPDFALKPPAGFVSNHARLGPDGTIMLGGQWDHDLTRSLVYLRLHPDGTFDPAFALPVDRADNSFEFLGDGRLLSNHEVLGPDGWPEPVLSSGSSRLPLWGAVITPDNSLWAPTHEIPLPSGVIEPFPTSYGTIDRYAQVTDRSVLISPADRSVTAGSPTSFAIGLGDLTDASIQWFKDEVSLAGATGPHLEIAETRAGDAGIYHAVVSYPDASYTSAAAELTIRSNTTRLTNFSARSRVAGDAPQYAGLVLRGNAPRDLLIRSIGNGLRPYWSALDPTPLMGAPELVLHLADGSPSPHSPLSVLDPAITAVADRLGAFPLPDGLVGDSGSDDPYHFGAALNPALGPEPFTATVRPRDGVPGGAGLLEIYDAGIDQDRVLTNVSLRATAGTGTDVLIGGFVLEGDGPARVLIRAVGPSLATYGVSSPLSDPVLRLYRHTAEQAKNDGWQNDPEIAAVAEAVGAFPLPADSADAALLVKLPPGAYTAQVHAGEGAGPAEALLEIYLLDPAGVSNN